MVPTALIVGAGIGGLTTAIALRKAGFKVRVVEQQENKSESGFGLSLPPNATRVLRSLGLDLKKVQAVVNSGRTSVRADRSQMEIVELVSNPEGKTHSDPQNLTVHRIDLHNGLKELATGEGDGPAAQIRYGRFVTSFNPATGSVHFANGESLEADLVVAADGCRSKAHKWIIGEEWPVRWTGLSNIRFTIPTDALLQHEDTHQILNTSPGMTTYRGSHPGKIVFRYACRDNTLRNFGLYLYTSDPAASEQNRRNQTLRQMARKQLEGFNNAMQNLLGLVEEDSMYPWKVLERDPLPVYYKDRLIILGDAAHPMLPNLGNGAAQSIEDAGVLGLVLNDVNSLDRIKDRLHAWDKLRRPRASAVQLMCIYLLAMVMPYKVPENMDEMIRQYVSESKLPNLTRSQIEQWVYWHDCLAEARRLILSLSK